jgi:hypothetical protein
MENDCKAIALGQKDVKSVVRSCMEQVRINSPLQIPSALANPGRYSSII